VQALEELIRLRVQAHECARDLRAQLQGSNAQSSAPVLQVNGQQAALVPVVVDEQTPEQQQRTADLAVVVDDEHCWRSAPLPSTALDHGRSAVHLAQQKEGQKSDYLVVWSTLHALDHALDSMVTVSRYVVCFQQFTSC
jgi:hypothetical protein